MLFLVSLRAYIDLIMLIYIQAPFMEACQLTLTTPGAIQCLQKFRGLFAKTGDHAHEHWFICDNQEELLKFQVALDREASSLFDHYECEHGNPKANQVFEDAHADLDRVHDGLRCYLQIIKLEGYENPCQSFAKKELKHAIQCYSPVNSLFSIHKEIMTTDKSYIDMIAEQSDSTSCEVWCDWIALNCLRAYLAYVVHLNLAHAIGYPTDLTAECKEMVSQISEILDRLHMAKEQSRVQIFLPDRFGVISQSELMSLIDGYMTEWDDKPMSDNQELARHCGQMLDKKFPSAYEWCVITAEDSSKLRNFLIYSDYPNELWLQESTHSQIAPLIGSAHGPDYKIYSKGNEHGVITCGKSVTIGGMAVHRRRLTVFWRQHDGHAPLSFALLDVLRRVDIKELAPVDKKDRIRERSGYRNAQQDSFEDALFRSDSDYVVCMGLHHERKEDELGFYVTPKNGRPATWPHRVDNDTGYLFLWLTPSTEATLAYRKQKTPLSALMSALTIAGAIVHE